MPTPQTTTTTTSMHPACSAPTASNDSISPIKEKDVVKSSTLAAATSRPFNNTNTTTVRTSSSRRPIYGRRSISFDPRLNSRVRNEHRVPNNVSVTVRSSSRCLENNVTVREKAKREVVEAGLSSTLSTKNSHHDGENNADDGGALEVCKESLSPDVADYRVNRDNYNDGDDQVSGTDTRRPKPVKRRLSYAKNEKENGNELEHDNNTKSTKKSTFGKTNHRNKAKRRRWTTNLTNENSRRHPNKDKEENLSFTESSEQEEQPPDPHAKSSSRRHRRRRSSTGTKATTTTITIRTKSNKNGRIIQSGGNIKSYMKELRQLAKVNNGTATQYKATYHTGSKPIYDKNDTTGHVMIQVGQLIIKETYVTCKGNKGGNSYSFDEWKLPGSKRRDSSIYECTRPKLVAVNGGKSAVITTCAPQLIVDTALSTLDADRVGRFVMGAKCGQTPMEFVAMMSEEEDTENDEDDNDDEVLFSGSIVSEVDEGGGEVERKVLGDKSNRVERNQIKGDVHNSTEMKLSNKYHKGRTQSARKKRKSAQISPTEPRKKRMVDSIVRFYVPESKEGSQKFFGLIEGIGGGLEEEGLSNVTPHRGRLLELPGSVLSGQWEARLIKDTVKSNTNEKSLRISLRHESSSLRPLENFLTGKDDLADGGGQFVSVLKPIISRADSLIRQGVMLEDEIEVDDHGIEQVFSNAFIACVSIVLFDGFLSCSQYVDESSGVASTFLKKCVPSNELQIGRELYGIVGNEHDANDDENITGMLYPCNVSLESEHTIILLQNEELEVSGIDVIFSPSIEGLKQDFLTEVMLNDHLDQIGSDEGEIMERYIEKNTVRVLERPSPLKLKTASVISHSDDYTENGEGVEEVVQSDNESHGFGGDDEIGFDANNEEISSSRESKEVNEVHDQEGSRSLGDTEHADFDAKKENSSLVEDSKDENEVRRLQEESLTLKQRIEDLEEEKRLLAQQIVKQILEKKTATPTECVVEQSAATDEAKGSPKQNEPPDTTLASSKKPKKKSCAEILEENDSALVEERDRLEGVDGATINPETLDTAHTSSTRPEKKSFAEIFEHNDPAFDEQRRKQPNVEKDAIAVTSVEKKNTVALKDLFGDDDSLFGVSTKKVNRRKSTGDVSNTRASIQKQQRDGRHSTGGLMKTHKQVQKEKSRRPTAPKVMVAARPPKSAAQLGDPVEKRPESTKENNMERRRRASSTSMANPTSEPKLTRRGAGKKTIKKTKVSNRRSTHLIEASDMNSFSVRKLGAANRTKINVTDLFGDSESMFGGVTKRPSTTKKVTTTKSAEPLLNPNNDADSLSSLGGGSVSFESASTQAICKPTDIATNDGNISTTQPMFDIYFGKDVDTSIVSTIDEDAASVPSVEEQPFFDYYFGQDLSGANDDESTQYPIQPLYSVYYGGLFEEQSTQRSVTSSFEIPTVPLSLYYFDNDDIVPARLSTSRFPFFDYYFGQVDDDEASSTPVWSPQHLPVATTDHPSFYDYYFGQEDVVDDQMLQSVATKTSWRCKLATCLQCLIVGVLPALLPLAMLAAKQNGSDDLSQQFDANIVIDIVEETADSWWSLKPWE